MIQFHMMFAITSFLLALGPLLSVSGALIDQYGRQEADLLPSPGYGQDEKTNCHKVEKVVFKDFCEPYTEETCWTQNKETCITENYKNCTGVIQTDMDRACFDVTEMLCDLEESFHYESAEETFQVMRCFTATDRVCDTTYNIDTQTKDDYQCLTVETPNCYQEEQTINDITCTDTVEFQCGAKQLSEYGAKQVVCVRFPKKDCYQVPRKVLVEVCQQDFYDYCEKFTNTVPFPVEDQNCHFEPKKICEIQDKSKPKKAKKYSYTKDCKQVDRQICAQVEKKRIQPVCDLEQRLKCDYEPVVKCEEQTKLYCNKVEEVVVEEVCDKKFETSYL